MAYVLRLCWLIVRPSGGRAELGHNRLPHVLRHGWDIWNHLEGGHGLHTVFIHNAMEGFATRRSFGTGAACEAVTAALLRVLLSRHAPAHALHPGPGLF